MIKNILADYRAILKNDPAVRGKLEALLCYPGFHALTVHRLCHRLWKWRLYLLARLISTVVRSWTGIEIHPGAVIGNGVFIDHGMGIVIGETAIVGDGTVLFHGVTLGGTGRHTGKRHPTVGNNAVLGAGAIILGPISIGDGAKVGAGAIVLKDIPAGATVVGIPPNQRILGVNTEGVGRT